MVFGKVGRFSKTPFAYLLTIGSFLKLVLFHGRKKKDKPLWAFFYHIVTSVLYNVDGLEPGGFLAQKN